jgi:DNA-binding LacI/PurR family transcriptional regulator
VTDPFFSKFIEAIEIVASDHKYKLIICQTRYLPEKEMEYLQLLSTKQVDGIILCSLENQWEDVEPYLQHGPIVLCNEYIEEANIPTVNFDHAQGAYIAAKHVLDQGYRHLVFCRGKETKVVSQQRKMGFLRAVTEKSKQVESIDFIESAYSVEDGKNMFYEFLQDKKNPTAILAGGDEVAAGIITEASKHNWSIPDDLAVVGFDNQFLSQITDSGITTIDQPIDEMARKVVELMMDKIHTKNYRNKEVYEFELELLVKGSTVKDTMMPA